MAMRGRILAGLVVVAVGACAHHPRASPEPAAPGPTATAPANFTYAYVAPTSPALTGIHQRVSARDLLRGLPEVRWLDGLLVLPAPIAYIAAECGEPGAYYLPASREVVLCYELLQVLYEQGEQLAESGDAAIDAAATTAASPSVAERYVWANVRFIVAHETGHALIDLLDLPVTGRQEDAVDQFATSLMQRIASEDESPRQVAENLRLAGLWFLARADAARADSGISLDSYADIHSLDLQRYFNLQCLLYGSDPERFADIVARGDLPESRARYCPAEAKRAGRAWLRLLLPHLAPEYEMTEAEAEAWLEQRERARQHHGVAPTPMP